jgi:ferric-dicitrate binding protein FerR (iron transport regulator)
METPQRLAYLLRRYLERNCTLQEKDELFILIGQAENDDTLRQLIEETWNEEHPSYPQDRARADNILREIISHRSSEPPPAGVRRRLPVLLRPGRRVILYGRLATACILGFLLLSTLTFHLFHRSPHPSSVILSPPSVRAQPAPGDRCITLSDGSKILLHQTARLDYPANFSPAQREVTLHGEAYFDIRRDTRPFIVHTGAIRITVLGTAFNIDAHNEQNIVITVAKGKVKVENGKGQYSILRRNEQLSADSAHLQKMLVNAGTAITWKKAWLLFNDVPMREAMDTLAARYHLTVVFTHPAAGNCPVTATFGGGETLDQMLSVLSKINNMEYSINHDRVTVTGNGCQ